MSAIDLPGTPVLDDALLSTMRVKGEPIKRPGLPDLPTMKDPPGNINTLNQIILEKAGKRFKKILYENTYPYAYDFVTNSPVRNDNLVGRMSIPVTSELEMKHVTEGGKMNLHPLVKHMKRKLWRKAVRHAAKKFTGRGYGIDYNVYPEPDLPEYEIGLYAPMSKGSGPKGGAPIAAPSGLPSGLPDMGSTGSLAGTITSLAVPIITKGVSALVKVVKKKIAKRKEKKAKAKADKAKEEQSKTPTTNPVVSPTTTTTTTPGTTIPATLNFSSEALSGGIPTSEDYKTANTIIYAARDPATSSKISQEQLDQANDISKRYKKHIRGYGIVARGIVARGEPLTPNQIEEAQKAAKNASDKGLVGMPNPYSYPKYPKVDMSTKKDGPSLVSHVYNAARKGLYEVAKEAKIPSNIAVPHINKYINKHATQTFGKGARKYLLGPRFKGINKENKIRSPYLMTDILKPLMNLNAKRGIELERHNRILAHPALNIPLGRGGIKEMNQSLVSFFKNPQGEKISIPDTKENIAKDIKNLAIYGAHAVSKLIPSLSHSIGKLAHKFASLTNHPIIASHVIPAIKESLANISKGDIEKGLTVARGGGASLGLMRSILGAQYRKIRKGKGIVGHGPYDIEAEWEYEPIDFRISQAIEPDWEEHIAKESIEPFPNPQQPRHIPTTSEDPITHYYGPGPTAHQAISEESTTMTPRMQLEKTIMESNLGRPIPLQEFFAIKRLVAMSEFSPRSRILQPSTIHTPPPSHWRMLPDESGRLHRVYTNPDVAPLIHKPNKEMIAKFAMKKYGRSVKDLSEKQKKKLMKKIFKKMTKMSAKPIKTKKAKKSKITKIVPSSDEGESESDGITDDIKNDLKTTIENKMEEGPVQHFPVMIRPRDHPGPFRDTANTSAIMGGSMRALQVAGISKKIIQ